MKPCPVCPGEGVYLGALGSLAHFRCRDCGMEFHKSIPYAQFCHTPEECAGNGYCPKDIVCID